MEEEFLLGQPSRTEQRFPLQHPALARVLPQLWLPDTVDASTPKTEVLEHVAHWSRVLVYVTGLLQPCLSVPLLCRTWSQQAASWLSANSPSQCKELKACALLCLGCQGGTTLPCVASLAPILPTVRDHRYLQFLPFPCPTLAAGAACWALGLSACLQMLAFTLWKASACSCLPRLAHGLTVVFHPMDGHDGSRGSKNFPLAFAPGPALWWLPRVCPGLTDTSEAPDSSLSLLVRAASCSSQNLEDELQEDQGWQECLEGLP